MKRFSIVLMSVIIGVIIGLGVGYAAWQRADAPSTTHDNTGTTSSELTKRCTAPDMTLSYADDESGNTAGTSYGSLIFRNSSQQTCTLMGYPNVSLVDEAGTQIGKPAEQDANVSGSDGVSELSIKPGQTIHAAIKFASSASDNTCANGATRVRVALPEDSGFLSVPITHGQYCTGFTTGPLSQ